MFKQFADESVDTIEVILNGTTLHVPQGISVAAAVLGRQQRFTRTTPVSGSQRAPFCMMGVCYDCLMVIDAQPNQRACVTLVQAGMQIECQQGVGPALESGV
jgi:predicted molibdopterin-dependent oxidoreductase YjgC